jgi:hypothetical protein
MIRPLRQRHRLIVCTLGILLPVAFTAGIAARRSVPMVNSVPKELESKASEFGMVVWTKTDLWPGRGIITSLRRDTVGALAVDLMFRDLVRPDVLVYWTPGTELTGEGLPESARLLGVLANRAPLQIPADVRGEAGRFLLYSLAEHERVATSKSFIVQKN